ncbi:MAG: DUF934 domain-containing protein [Hyphomicrobiaceae bacterium]
MSEPTLLLLPLPPLQGAPRLWRSGQFVDNPWRLMRDDEPFPIGGWAILSLARWRADHAAQVVFDVPLGVRLAVADSLDMPADDVGRLAVVVLPFPKFSDGRSYSTARRLRDAGYLGEIRATGDVLLDQLPLMLRSGFDSFEIVDAATIKALETASLPSVTRIYQAGTDASGAMWLSRRGTIQASA